MIERTTTESTTPSKQPQGLGDKLEFSDIYPEFVHNLRHVMERRNIRFKGLQNATGLSRPTLRRMYDGTGNPVIGNLYKVSEAVGERLVDLLGPQRKNTRVPLDTETRAEALLAYPPAGDSRSVTIYQALCHGVSEESVQNLAKDLEYPLPGESPKKAVRRAVLDALYNHQVWVDAAALQRDEALENQIVERYSLKRFDRLSDPKPVRVVDLDPNLFPLLQLLAVAGMAGSMLREFLEFKSCLGFSDGFSASTVLNFLRRGDLNKATLVPLVVTPHLAQFELSGLTLTGAMARQHQGYHIQASINYKDLPEQLNEVGIAVMACGCVEKERGSRIRRLLRDAKYTKESYDALMNRLQQKNVAGDLMYHFLHKSGRHMPEPEVSAPLESASPSQLTKVARGGPLVYSASLSYLKSVAERGVSLLLAHSANRAELVHAALTRSERPVNFLVLARATAEKLVRM